MQEPEAEPEVAREAREPVGTRQAMPIPTPRRESALLQESQEGSRLERDLAKKAEPSRQAAQRPEPGDKPFARLLITHLQQQEHDGEEITKAIKINKLCYTKHPSSICG